MEGFEIEKFTDMTDAPGATGVNVWLGGIERRRGHVPGEPSAWFAAVFVKGLDTPEVHQLAHETASVDEAFELAARVPMPVPGPRALRWTLNITGPAARVEIRT